MHPIYEFSAAPHMPEAMKGTIPSSRPEEFVSAIVMGMDSSDEIELRMHNGEIYITFRAAA